MSIQSAINQNLSVMALVMSQSGAYKRKVESKMVEKDYKKAEQYEHTALQNFEKASDELYEQNKDRTPLQQAQADVTFLEENPAVAELVEASERTSALAQRAAELNPTAANIKRSALSRYTQRSAMEESLREAQERVKMEQERLARTPKSTLYDEPDPTEAIRRAGDWYKYHKEET